MRKIYIQNRDDVNLSVVIEQTPDQTGLVFVMPGQGGFKEQGHIRAFVQAFLDKGFTVVSFDPANTIGESGGHIEQATITNYYADLEDVIAWASRQPWYIAPFVLAGHSLGGICTALYAEHYPDKVKALAPISTVVSGKLSLEAHGPEEINEWKQHGRTLHSNAKPGVSYILPWSNMEDRLQYDLLINADKLTMPVLLMAGDQDTSTPYAHQELLYEAIPTDHKELHKIKNAKHTFRTKEQFEQISAILGDWIEKYLL